jgi:hypothetical protein
VTEGPKGRLWSSKPVSMTRRAPLRNVTRVAPGPAGEASDRTLDGAGLFGLFLDDQTVQNVVELTNVRMQQGGTVTGAT